MSRALLATLMVSLSVLCAQRARASLIWLNDNRRVENQNVSYVGGGYTNIDRPSTPFAAWSAGYQVSDLGPDHINASISSSYSPLFGWIVGTYQQIGYTRVVSYVDVDFRLTEPTAYTLNLNPPSEIYVPWGCSIKDAGGNSVGGSGTTAGVLPAGDYNYTLFIGADMSMYPGHGDAQFTLLVPEPASLSLLAVSGTALLLRPRAGRNRAALR